MNLTEVLGREVFRPLATLVIPGVTALAPYVVILLHYFPGLKAFWDKSPSTITFILVLFAVASGLVLECLGSFVEFLISNSILAMIDSEFKNTLNNYLKLKFDQSSEPIGQGFYQWVILHLKFELNFISALPFTWFGLFWLNNICDFWSQSFFLFATFFLFVLFIYLLAEAYQSSKTLAYVRSLLVKSRPPERTSKFEEREKKLEWVLRYILFFLNIVLLLMAFILVGSSQTAKRHYPVEESRVDFIDIRYYQDVGPFGEASDAISNQAISGSIATLTVLLENDLKDYDLELLILIGRADKRPIHPNSRYKKYGSNLSLAYARAVTVEDYLLKHFSGRIDDSKIIKLSAGGHVYIPSNEFEKDRVVSVYAVRRKRVYPGK